MPKTHRLPRILSAAAGILAAAIPQSLALVDYTMQSRFVAASQNSAGGAPGQVSSAMIAAPDFGPFSEFVEAQTGIFNGSPFGNRSRGDQSSMLQPDAIIFSGTAFAHSVEAFAGSGRAEAQSSLTVRFTITEPTPFTLLAMSDVTPGAGWLHPDALDAARVALLHIGGSAIIDVSINQFAQPGPSPLANLLESGTLAPGEYEFISTLTRRGVTTQNHGGGTSNLTASLQLPAPSAAALALLGLATISRRRRGS